MLRDQAISPRTALDKWKASFSWEKAAFAVFILVGIVLRLRQYLTGRSLWADEAMLALNIVNRSFAGIFQPLDYDQGAPIGFLLVEKVFSSILGRSEFALRLFPLLAGLISLLLFYLLLKKVTSKAGLLTALALFVFNPRLIYYSSEVKQYIVDVAVTVFLLLIAARVFNPSPKKRDFVSLTLVGLLALWFSHPALFVLAGIGFALVIIYLNRRDYPNLKLVIGMGILWVLNIGFLYLLILKDLSQNTYMREYWQGAFLPMPPWNQPGWFVKNLNQNIGIQLGIPYFPLFVFMLMLVGWLILFFQHRDFAVVIACILFVTFAASALQLYPLFERMILFLVPLGFILLGKTIEFLYQRLHNYPFVNALLVLLLADYLILGPVTTSISNFVTPKYFEHIRPTMQHLHDSWKEGDVMYVSNGALPAFRFYAPFYGLENIPYKFGRREDYQNPQNILRSLDSVQGQARVWILFSHVYEKDGWNEKDFILNYINQTGQKKREFRVPGTSVFLYLYDLRKK